MKEIEPFDPINATHIPNRDKYSAAAVSTAIKMGDVNHCLICGNRTNICRGSKSRVEFARFCSQECRMINRHNHKDEIAAKRRETNLKKFSVENPFTSKVVREKIKQTNLKRFGVENVFRSERIREKIKQTNFKRYGVEYNGQRDDVKQKIKETNIERYGFESPSANSIIREKIELTNLDRYGYRHPMQSKEVQDRTHYTNLERYGVECVTEMEGFRETVKSTWMKNYGVDNPMKSSIVQEKSKQTNLERYGAENVFNSPEIKERIKKTNIDKYGVENVFSSPLIQDQIRSTNLKNLGVSYPMQSDAVQQTMRDSNLVKWGYEYICQVPEVQERMRQTCIERYGIWPPSKTKPEQIEEFIRLAKDGWNCQTISNAVGTSPQVIKRYLLENDIIPPTKTTAPEAKIKQFLDDNYTGTVVMHDRNVLAPKEIDIWLPDLKLGIEVNGEYWHSEAHNPNRLNVYDKWKQAKDLGIQIIELNTIEIDLRFEQICNLLLSKLVPSDAVFARKCDVEWVTNSMYVCDFINRNHIQPIRHLRKNEWCYGLRFGGKMVAMCLFAPHHRQGHPEIVLKRFCCEKGIRVIGGASKLLKYAMKMNEWKHVISWSDNRFSTGNLYEKIGFKLEEELDPDYAYWDIMNDVIHGKQSCKKANIGCRAGQTERDRAIELGLYRIWDCGKKRWGIRV